MDYLTHFKDVIRSKNIPPTVIKSKIEQLIGLGDDAYLLAEIHLKSSHTICLLDDPELLRNYLHTFYHRFCQGEEISQKNRKLILLKEFCKKIGSSSTLLKTIDEIIVQRSINYRLQDL